MKNLKVDSKPKNHRQSNIELLRIVSMLFIIMFHYVYKSGYTSPTFTFNYFIVKLFYMLGELGVNIFILISGYFMIKGKFSIKKLIKLLLEVEFYYLFSVFIASKLGIYTVSHTFKGIFMLFFPTTLNRYWFITVYVLIYILSPYLNILANNMDKKTYQKFLFTVLLIWCVIPTFFGLFFNGTESMLYYSRFIWLIIIYFVGAYIRLNPVNIFSKNNNAIICFSISTVATIIGILGFYKFRNILANLGTTEIAYFWQPNSILMFLLSISLFTIFLKVKINYNFIINKLASTTLAVYMLHDGILQGYIWNNIFKTKMRLGGGYSIIHILIATVIIYLVGSVIDLIRQFLFDNVLDRLINNFKSKKASVQLN